MVDVRACRLPQLPPGKVGGLVIDCFLALKPQSHLFDIIAFVAGTVGVLSIVDVQAFRVFRVVSVGTAECSDRSNIVHEQVNLGHVEVIAYSQLDEGILMPVEQS